MAIKIYCVTKERLTGLDHWGYFIFIDTFSTVQEDFDLRLYIFVHPGQLPGGAVSQISFTLCYGSTIEDKAKQAQSSSQTFSPWQPLALNIRASEKRICSVDSFSESFDPMVEDGL